MRLPLILFVLLAAGAPRLEAQHADQKALEAAVRELAPMDETPIYVSPVIIAPQVRGNVKIDAENRERLEERFQAHIEELEDVVRCEDVAAPETCTIRDGGLIFQFFMPEPVKNGVLGLALLLLKEDTSEGSQIEREWWNLALLQRPDLGWTVVGKELTDTAPGPW